MDDKFKIKSYGFGELAQMYFPSISKKSAAAQMRSWLKSCERVMPLLNNIGYKPGNRLLTPAQVKVIVDQFGEP